MTTDEPEVNSWAAANEARIRALGGLSTSAMGRTALQQLDDLQKDYNAELAAHAFTRGELTKAQRALAVANQDLTAALAANFGLGQRLARTEAELGSALGALNDKGRGTDA